MAADAAKVVAILGTLDTKGAEFAYLKAEIQKAGAQTLVIDTGTMAPPAFSPEIPASDVARAAGTSLEAIAAKRDRGEAVEAMGRGAAALLEALARAGKIDAAIAMGGGGGTAIGATAMQALPVGFPKLIVSTLAAGDISAYVGVKDITMMPSVVDISGLNRLSTQIIANAAGAIAGMANVDRTAPAETKPLLAATMFGVTTPCVTRAREVLEAAGYEVLVFHATGTGGRTMEALIRAGFIAGVLDMTTTELADELAGGVLSAGPNRLEAAGERGIPQVVSVGALDMVNFGPRDTVPEKHAQRTFYQHNPMVTLMRTTAAENAELGEILARKLNAATGPTVLMLPERGVSAIDVPGKPFYDADADTALFKAITANIGPNVTVIERNLDINDPAFAEEAAQQLLTLVGGDRVQG